jgi:hypothetical protein
VGWWELDDGSGTIASDSSGHGNDGILALNGTAWDSTDPAVGTYAIALSGTHATPDTGHVEVAHSDTLSFGTSDFTIAVWVRRDAGEDRDDIITKKDDIADLSFYIDSEHQLTLYRKGGESVLSDTPIPTEQWVHLSATRQEGAVQFYIDAVPAGSGINDLDLASTGVLRIGSNRRPSDDATMNPLEGLIDDARIYDRALTAAEILELTGQ